ncbi:MAG: hypothetical protein KDA31_10340 [Phycisphaerales bacterium]|nr:hypothetical protein [Phycisphaerales bacterium]MCB9837498.1 hypothetical protein [Phycisphaera sp.]
MRGIAEPAENYFREHGRYPSEQELRAYDDGADYLLTYTGDGWRRRLNYVATDGVLVIHSYGEDGVLSGDDIYYSTLPEEAEPIPDE